MLDVSFFFSSTNTTLSHTASKSGVAKRVLKRYVELHSSQVLQKNCKGLLNNHSKPEILLKLFNAYVYSERTSNGRQTGKVRYWFMSNYKRIRKNKGRKEPRSECFLSCFQDFLQGLCDKGLPFGFS